MRLIRLPAAALHRLTRIGQDRGGAQGSEYALESRTRLFADLFDEQWYSAQNPDVLAAKEPLLGHYAAHGYREGRRPHPLFDPEWYARDVPELQSKDADPLEHFLRSSPESARSPHPLFDSQWYLKNNPDVIASGMNPLVHFLKHGAMEDRDPHPLFSLSWYRRKAGDRQGQGENPLLHFMRARAGQCDPHPLFDLRWYSEKVGDALSDPNVDPLTHYVTAGATLPFSPHPLFDPIWYRSQHPRGLRPQDPPLLHYVTVDAARRADPNAVFKDRWYDENHPEGRDRKFPPLARYVAFGAAEGCRPDPDFDPAWYGERHGANGSPIAPLVHLLASGAPADITTQPVVARHRVAVVFLAWSADGSARGLDPFARSYAATPAGEDHDLIVIRKGAAGKPGARQALNILFGAFNPQFIDVDDFGQDIHAYIKAAKVLPHEILCFCNNYSSIRGDSWLKKLLAPFDDPKVGVAGATASFESISDTTDMISKVVWLANRNELPAEPEILELFGEQLAAHAPDWLERARLGSVEVKERDVVFDRDVEYAKYWLDITAPGGPLAGFDQFKRFPNPHLRSNGLVIRRSVLLDLGFELSEDGKLPCSLFESGPDGLRARLSDRGLRAVLVGANGRAYEVEEWPESNTFRLGDQENVLLCDNRVDEFPTFKPAVRSFQKMVSWGEYIAPTPSSIKGLGYKFERSPLLGREARRGSLSTRPYTIGVALPSHNGARLVRDALKTLVAQDYEHWTCTVFDNASSENLRGVVEEFADPRIVCERSDNFLPVTDSWNEAVDRAKGDYIVLIGDDDGFAPGAFRRLVGMIDDFSYPEVVYSALWQFMHPGVLPSEPAGSVSLLKYAFFFGSRQTPFVLDAKLAQLAVAGSLNLRRNCTFNMQGFFFRRDFLDQIRGPDGKVFQSPFPDYHLANVALALARDVLVVPEPLSIQGVSRKSFGFTLFNNEPARGDSLLNTDLRHDRWYEKFSQYKLWGPSYDAKFTLTMEHVAHAVGEVLPIGVNVERYRKLQIFKALGEIRGLVLGGVEQGAYVDHVEGELSPHEREWAEGLRALGRRYQSGDETAGPGLDRVAAAATMYAPPSLAVQSDLIWRAEFDGLPALFQRLQERTAPSGH